MCFANAFKQAFLLHIHNVGVQLLPQHPFHCEGQLTPLLKISVPHIALPQYNTVDGGGPFSGASPLLATRIARSFSRAAL